MSKLDKIMEKLLNMMDDTVHTERLAHLAAAYESLAVAKAMLASEETP